MYLGLNGLRLLNSSAPGVARGKGKKMGSRIDDISCRRKCHQDKDDDGRRKLNASFLS